MLTQQTRSLQPEPIRNPVTPLSSVMATQTAEQMAGEAAIRRAGPTASSFEPVAHMERAEKDLAGGGRVGFSEEPVPSSFKRGRRKKDTSGFAVGEPVGDVLAFRQEKPDLSALQAIPVAKRTPPSRSKSMGPLASVSFLPTQPPTLSPAVNAAAEQFVPNQAPRGRLGSESSIETRSDSDDEPKQAARREAELRTKKNRSGDEQQEMMRLSSSRQLNALFKQKFG